MFCISHKVCCYVYDLCLCSMSHTIYLSWFTSFCHQRSMYGADIVFVHSAENYCHIRCILSETNFHTKFLFCTWYGVIVTPYSEVSMVVILVVLIAEITWEQIWVACNGTMLMASLVNTLWLCGCFTYVLMCLSLKNSTFCPHRGMWVLFGFENTLEFFPFTELTDWIL